MFEITFRDDENWAPRYYVAFSFSKDGHTLYATSYDPVSEMYDHYVFDVSSIESIVCVPTCGRNK